MMVLTDNVTLCSSPLSVNIAFTILPTGPLSLIVKSATGEPIRYHPPLAIVLVEYVQFVASEDGQSSSMSHFTTVLLVHSVIIALDAPIINALPTSAFLNTAEPAVNVISLPVVAPKTHEADKSVFAI